jgi:hypothetical protein
MVKEVVFATPSDVSNRLAFSDVAKLLDSNIG